MKELTEQEELENLAKIIEELQHSVNRIGRSRGLTGHEWHALNVLDMGLFNLLVVAKLAAGTIKKAEGEQQCQ